MGGTQNIHRSSVINVGGVLLLRPTGEYLRPCKKVNFLTWYGKKISWQDIDTVKTYILTRPATLNPHEEIIFSSISVFQSDSNALACGTLIAMSCCNTG